MTLPNPAPPPKGGLRDFEDLHVAPIHPDEVNWGTVGRHLRATYEVMYAHGGAVRSVRSLASLTGRSSSTADRHLRALADAGLVQVEDGVPGLAEESRASVVRLVRKPRHSAGGFVGHVEVPVLREVEDHEMPTDSLIVLLQEVVARYAPSHAVLLEPFRADERRWSRSQHGESGRLISLAWLRRGRPTFSTPEMAAWTGHDRGTIRKRLRRMEQSPSDGVAAHFDFSTRRWSLGVCLAVTAQQWDAICTAASSGEYLEGSALLRSVVVTDVVDRTYADERRAHRQMTRAAYAAKKGNSTDWVTGPRTGSPWRRVRPTGVIEVTVDVAGWPETTLIADPSHAWEEEVVEVVGPAGGTLRGVVPRPIRRESPPPHEMAPWVAEERATQSQGLAVFALA